MHTKCLPRFVGLTIIVVAFVISACSVPARPSRDGSPESVTDTTVSDKNPPGPDGAGGAPATDGALEHGTKANGDPCQAAADCESGFCADGVCCKTDCRDTCHTCKATGSEGTCVAVAAGQPDPRNLCQDEGLSSCGKNGKCDGLGKCELYPKGVVCRPRSCVGSAITNASTCNGDGACTANGEPGSCAPYACDPDTNACRQSCTTDAECTAGNYCRNGSCGLLPPGATCGSGTQCASHLCQQGVCCKTECSGTCMSCNLPGSEGTCTAVPEGQDPLEQCATNAGSTCLQDGTCDGSGKCRLWVAGTECKGAACANGAKTLASQCDGSGNCVAGDILSCTPYVCSSAAECGSSCTADKDCAPPNSCQGGKCDTKPNGKVCSSGTECKSGQCEQGYCCDSICPSPCKSCATGICTNVAEGLDPKDECVSETAATCGRTGTCDGTGKCGLYSTGTQCKGASCPSGSSTFTGVSRCNGSGLCVDASPTSCSPFMCNSATASCLLSCTGNAQCTTGNFCSGGSCGLKPPGGSCTLGGDCQSGICAQGVCCQTTCTGTCMSCGVPGSEGTCSPIPSGTAAPSGQCDDNGGASCGTNGKCDGKGACALYSSGTACGGASCTNGAASSARTCNGSGLCSPATTTSCSPYVCGTTACKTSCSGDSDCVSPYTCQSNQCRLAPTGATCTNDAMCASGTCAQGRCCSTACTGCKSCAISGKEGTCTNLSAGTAPSPASTCAASAASTCGLDGKCDGAGACRKWPSGTTCAGASCPTTASTLTQAKQCDGLGNCSLGGGTTTCSPYMCDGTTCRTSCTGNTQCTSGNSCSGGACGLLPNGATCSGDALCNSGHCVDGYCCNDGCTGTCRSCKLAGKEGVCSLITAGEDPDAECADQGAGTCGTDGYCDGNGACGAYASGTLCTTGSTCSGNSSVGPSTCQSGTCTAATPVSCGVYACSAGACKTSCASDADCASPNTCTGTTCGMTTNVTLEFQCGLTSASSTWIKPHYRLTNLATTTIPLSEFTIRYWISKDAATTLDWACDWAALGCGNLSFAANLATGKTDATANAYFETRFTAGAGNLTAGATTGMIQLGFHDRNYVMLTQTNDYSFDASKTAYAEWNHVTVYRNGTLVYGIEPN